MMKNGTDDLDEDLSLNPDFASVMKIIGFENMLKLSAACAGRIIYIPLSDEYATKRNKTLVLDEIIGRAAVSALARIYGGLQYEVSTDLCRKIHILNDLASGASILSISAKYWINRGTISRFAREVKKTGCVKISKSRIPLPPAMVQRIRQRKSKNAQR